jgi:hypothetical protein
VCGRQADVAGRETGSVIDRVLFVGVCRPPCGVPVMGETRSTPFSPTAQGRDQDGNMRWCNLARHSGQPVARPLLSRCPRRRALYIHSLPGSLALLPARRGPRHNPPHESHRRASGICPANRTGMGPTDERMATNPGSSTDSARQDMRSRTRCTYPAHAASSLPCVSSAASWPPDPVRSVRKKEATR